MTSKLIMIQDGVISRLDALKVEYGLSYSTAIEWALDGFPDGRKGRNNIKSPKK